MTVRADEDTLIRRHLQMDDTCRVTELTGFLKTLSDFGTRAIDHTNHVVIGVTSYTCEAQ